MYKNLKEIAAHKQRLWFKKSYSREIFLLIGYWIVELVFLEWNFLYIKKINCSPPILNAYYMYVRGAHSARVFCMYNVFERHFCFRRVAILAVAAMNSFKFTGFFLEHELQQGYFMVTKYGTSLFSGMYLLKDGPVRI